MAKPTENLIQLAQELQGREDTSEELKVLTQELLRRGSEEKKQLPENVPFEEDLLQAVKEIPTDLEVGFKSLGASALQTLGRRGIQLNYATLRQLGVAEDEATQLAKETFLPVQAQQQQGFKPGSLLGPPATPAQQAISEIRKSDPGFGVGAEALRFGLRQPAVGSFLLKESAARKAETLPEASFSNNPITKITRSVMQSGVPSATTAFGAALLTGNPLIGLGVLGETEGSSAFFDQLESGASIPKASLIAELSEATEIATEAIVFPKIFKGLKKGIPLRDGLKLVLEGATQETVAGFSQEFLREYGILTTEGVDKTEAAKRAFDAGIKAIPESAITGGLTTGGTVGIVSTVQKINNRPPGSTTTEEKLPPSTPESRSTRIGSAEPLLETNENDRVAKIQIVNTQRLKAQSTAIDGTVKPTDQVAAEIQDQTTNTTEATEKRSVAWGQKRKQIAQLQEDLNLNDKEYRDEMYKSIEKNSTTAASLEEMDQFIADLNQIKGTKYLQTEPKRLKLTETDVKEVESLTQQSSFGHDLWRKTLENQLTPLPSDPFAHKKIWNDLKHSVDQQEKFLTKKNIKQDLSDRKFKIADGAEKVASFVGSFKSYRNFFADIETQTGVPVFGYYQNLIDSTAKAQNDSDRAVQLVLNQHEMKKVPAMNREQTKKVNKALFFRDPTDIEALSMQEKKWFEAAQDLFVSNPNVINTGPNAVRLRQFQWDTWNETYNENKPKISEAESEIESIQAEIKQTKQAVTITPEKLQSNIESLDKQIEEAKTEDERNQLITRQILQQALKKETEITGKPVTRMSEEQKKEQTKKKKRISDLKRNVTKWEKKIKDAVPLTGVGEGKAKKTEESVLLEGRKAVEEGKFFDWLRQQKFGTREIYFTTEDAFNSMLKDVESTVRPGNLDAEIPHPNTIIFDRALKSRTQEGDPLLEKNPFLVAQHRLKKLAIMAETRRPLVDLNQNMKKVWSSNLTKEQQSSYNLWLDNAMGIYKDPAVPTRLLQQVQKQWWRAKGWDPQFIAKFATRNIMQNALVAGQVPVTQFTKAAPKSFAGYLVQMNQAEQQTQQPGPIRQQEMLDAQNQLRDAINQSEEKGVQAIDPWLFEDWQTWATTEISQRAAQFKLLTMQENLTSTGQQSSWQDIMPRLMGASDTLNRFVTWMPLHQMAYDNVRHLRKGDIQQKQLWSRLSLDTLEAPQRKQLMGLLEQGQDRAFIRQYANMKTKNVHYAYDLLERSAAEQTAGSRSVLGVITWSRSALENYTRLANQGAQGIKQGDMQKAWQAYKGIASYITAFGLIGIGSSKLGRDPWYGIWSSINPLSFPGSPQAAFVGDTARDMRGTVDGLLAGESLDEDKVDRMMEILIKSGGTMTLPVAVGLLEGMQTAFEAQHNVKNTQKIDLLKIMVEGKAQAILGGEEAWRTEKERTLKFLFDEEAQETRDVKRIPGL